MKRSKIRQLLNYIPRPIVSYTYKILYYIRDGKGISECKRELHHYIDNDCNISEEEEKNLEQYCVFMYRAGADKYIDSYFGSSDFKCIQRILPEDIDSMDPILICCVKNDINRIKLIYEHHREIGIKNFVFVDNNSDDGTLEYIKSLPADIYQTDENYHAGRKAAWVKKVEDIYGYNRWYLIVDSDELFSYPGMEEHPIKELVEYANKNGINRIRSLLLDMYSNMPLFDSYKFNSPVDILSQYRFFDTNSYYINKDCKAPIIRGGPRKRIFEAESTHSQPLTKFPLLFVKKEDIWADHTPLPFEKNFDSPCLAVLRHYKFLPEDLEKFKKIAENGNYSNGSREYKTYMSCFNVDKSLTFWNKKSCEYVNSMSLKEIEILDEIQWI